MDNSHQDSYLVWMTHYSIAEAKNNLPKLIDRMLAGEEVTITRRGKPVARLEPQDRIVKQPPVDVDWLRRNMVYTNGGPDSVELVRMVRDDR